MKKGIVAVFVLALITCAGTLLADETAAPFRLDADLGANACLAGLYPYGEATFVWAPNSFFAIGASVDAYIGLTAMDVWIAPLARVELGWFYVTGGPAFLLTPLDHGTWMYPSLDANMGIYLGLGISHGLIKLGPGSLGFDARLSYAFAPVEFTPTSDNILGALFQSMAVAIVDVFAGIRLGAGLTYSLPIGG